VAGRKRVKYVRIESSFRFRVSDDCFIEKDFGLDQPKQGVLFSFLTFVAHLQRRVACMTISIALYQPDIAGNTGTILRTAACLGFNVEIIEPCGFDISDRNLRRAGLDYAELATLRRHTDWNAFESWRILEKRTLVLLSTKASTHYTDHRFIGDEVVLFGRESAGVPDEIHSAADTRLLIPMAEGRRSLNLAVSVGIVVAEALRQLR